MSIDAVHIHICIQLVIVNRGWRERESGYTWQQFMLEDTHRVKLGSEYSVVTRCM